MPRGLPGVTEAQGWPGLEPGKLSLSCQTPEARAPHPQKPRSRTPGGQLALPELSRPACLAGSSEVAPCHSEESGEQEKRGRAALPGDRARRGRQENPPPEVRGRARLLLRQGGLAGSWVSVQEGLGAAAPPRPVSAEPGRVRTLLDRTQPFCFIIVRVRGNLCFQIKEMHSTADR